MNAPSTIRTLFVATFAATIVALLNCGRSGFDERTGYARAAVIIGPDDAGACWQQVACPGSGGADAGTDGGNGGATVASSSPASSPAASTGSGGAASSSPAASTSASSGGSDAGTPWACPADVFSCDAFPMPVSGTALTNHRDCPGTGLCGGLKGDWYGNNAAVVEACPWALPAGLTLPAGGHCAKFAGGSDSNRTGVLRDTSATSLACSWGFCGGAADASGDLALFVGTVYFGAVMSSDPSDDTSSVWEAFHDYGNAPDSTWSKCGGSGGGELLQYFGADNLQTSYVTNWVTPCGNFGSHWHTLSPLVHVTHATPHHVAAKVEFGVNEPCSGTGAQPYPKDDNGLSVNCPSGLHMAITQWEDAPNEATAPNRARVVVAGPQGKGLRGKAGGGTLGLVATLLCDGRTFSAARCGQ